MNIRLSSDAVAGAVAACGLIFAATLYASQAGKAMNEADAELNAVYQKAIAGLKEGGFDKDLKAVQKAWVAFKEADVAFHAKLYPESKGGLWTNYALTVERTKQLKMVIKRESGDGYIPME